MLSAVQFPCCYIGSARHMDEQLWIRMNEIHLRSEWRRQCDIAAEWSLDMPDEGDYEMFCKAQYEQTRDFK